MSAPTKHQRRAALREQRLALRQRLQAQIAAQRNQPSFVAALERRQKRRRRALMLLACALLLLLLRCECEEPPPPLPVVAEAVGAPPVDNAPPPQTRPKKRKRALEGKVDGSKRGAMAVEPADTPPWLQQFRLQVSARSPRLAACFNGAERPGALRWSALVHARSGRVSESVVEPVFRGVELEQRQHDCLVQGLTNPPFQLDEPSPEAAARRVSLIFEF